MLREEHSLTDMLTCSIKTRTVTTTQSTRSFQRKIRRRESESSLPPTPISLNSPLWDMSSDMPRLIQTRSLFGRLSLEISQMELRLSLINSWCLEKPSGTLRTGLFSSCLTDMMDRDQSILHAGLRDTSFCVTKMSLFHPMVITITTKS